MDARVDRWGANVWLGANFWSRAGGPFMWEEYDPRVVRRELAVLAAHGLTVTRSFCFWPSFVPEPGRLDEEVTARFADFLDAHLAAGLGTIPTLVVGHMSGENWDPAWRGGRDLYRDVTLVAEQAWLAEELARRFGSHPAVVGWLLSNEMPLYGGSADAGAVTAWARLLVHALRAGGATQPVSVGDGAWGVETTGEDNGFSLRALAPLVDFVGPHSYPMDDDPVRQALSPAFACELAGGFGRPVVLEEFGVSSDFCSDEHAAAYYRQVLHTTLLAGARGWLAWCSADLDDLRDRDPYRHHVFELHFGLTDRDGRPKPQLLALRDFAATIGGLGDWERDAGDAAIVVPEHFERVLPFTEPAYRRDIRANLLQGYAAAREADLPVRLVRECDGLRTAARLVLAPCAKLLTGPGLARLHALAEGGATVYLSYFAGSTPNQRGPWLTGLDELFGVRHDLRYGLVDPIEGETVELDLLRPLGDLDAGERLTFAVAGTPSARSYLPVERAGAEVVAVDAARRPALLRHRLGAGQTILCTYPLEHLAARSPRVNPEDTRRLYSALAEEAGVARPVRAPDPRILAGRLRSASGDVAVFVNCSPDPIAADCAPVGPLVLAPYGAAVMPFAAAAAGEGRDAARSALVH